MFDSIDLARAGANRTRGGGVVKLYVNIYKAIMPLHMILIDTAFIRKSVNIYLISQLLFSLTTSQNGQ